MKTITVRKAENAVPDQIGPVCIQISGEFPKSKETGRRDLSSDELDTIFHNDALLVVNALKSLPGGTLGRVMALLMLEKASHFIVPMFDRPVSVTVTHERIG